MKPAKDAADDPQRERQEFERSEIARILAGETDRYEYFVRTYQKRIFRLAYTLLRDPAEADGLAQDVFVKAYRGLVDFKGAAAFETWVTRIAINAVRDLVRRRKPMVSFGGTSIPLSMIALRTRAWRPTTTPFIRIDSETVL